MNQNPGLWYLTLKTMQSECLITYEYDRRRKYFKIKIKRQKVMKMVA